MSNLIKWGPFAELSALQKQFFSDDWVIPLKSVNIPTTDVFMMDNQLVVEAHLPNFGQDDVSIQVEDNALVISAEKHEKETDKDKKYVVRESSSSFYRRISLPKRANADKIEAELVDGILKVHIPLTPLAEPKKIVLKSKNK